MIRIALTAAALAGAALAAGLDWRPEPALQNVDYVGRTPESGELLVEGWRLDGGLYVSDDHYALATISTDLRLGLMTEKFRHREDDGVVAWTITQALSVPADRETMFIDMTCGEGPGFTVEMSPTMLIVGIAPKGVTSDGPVYTGLAAAARIDLTSGTIEPIDPAGIYCIQEEAN